MLKKSLSDLQKLLLIIICLLTTNSIIGKAQSYEPILNPNSTWVQGYIHF